jgi:hypothetical protein
VLALVFGDGAGFGEGVVEFAEGLFGCGVVCLGGMGGLVG